MASLKYNDIFSRFFLKAEAYDLAELKDTQAYSMLRSWLRSSASKPFVRQLFSSLKMDDEVQVATYELKTQTDSDQDQDFVTEIFAIGMVIEWLEPRVNSLLNVTQVFGSKEEKFYSQSAHLTALQGLSQALKTEQKQMIANRGFFNNSYLSGGLS